MGHRKTAALENRVMIDLSTTYLGLKLRTPLVPSASPLSEDFDNIRRMEDAGAAAIVMHSLFEEQIEHERRELHYHLIEGTESYAEALTYFPEPNHFTVGPEAYVEHIRKAKESVKIPIIGSLNGSTPGGWITYAKQIEEAGADALELNIYFVPTDPRMTSTEVEQRYVDILSEVKSVVKIPIAVKLGPFFTNFAHLAGRLDQAGASGLVLFNRFYQLDIDLGSLEVTPNLLLTTSAATRLPLRWIAVLHGLVKADLAATSGIHRATDVLKMLMAGAQVTMLCSVLMRHGIARIGAIEQELREWLERQEYHSVNQLIGSVSQKKSADPSAFERALYVRSISTFRAH